VGSLGELARATVRQISGASQRNVEHMANALAKSQDNSPHSPTAPNHPSPSGRGTG